MKALILGATGLVGNHLYNLLVEDSFFEEINIITRRELPPHKRVKAYLGEKDTLDQIKQAFEVDILFCCLGTTIKKAKSQEAFKEVDYDYPLLAAKIFKELNPQGKFLIVSALGADANSGIFYNKTKGELENALRDLELSNLIIFQPSLILGSRSESRPAEAISQFLAKAFDPILKTVFPKYAGIEAEKIAKAMIDYSKKAKMKEKIVSSDEMKLFF